MHFLRVSSNLCKQQRTAFVICVQSAYCLRKQPAGKGQKSGFSYENKHACLNMQNERDTTDIDEESKNSKSRWIIQGRRQIGVDGLHVDYVHLEIKGTLRGRLHRTGLLQQLAGDSVELSTDRTVPPSGICGRPPGAPSRWRRGLPSGSAAGRCGTHLEDLRRSPTCRRPPAE